MRKRKCLLFALISGFVVLLMWHIGFSFLQNGNPELNPFLFSKKNVVRIWVNDEWNRKYLCYTAVKTRDDEWVYTKYRAHLFSAIEDRWDFAYSYLRKRQRFFPHESPSVDLGNYSPQITERLLARLSHGIEERDYANYPLGGCIYHFFLKIDGAVSKFTTSNLNCAPDERNLKDLYDLLLHINFMVDDEVGRYFRVRSDSSVNEASVAHRSLSEGDEAGAKGDEAAEGGVVVGFGDK